MARYDEKKQLKCSFCGKTQEQVKRLVAGPGVYICDECIELCSEIIEEEFEEAKVESDFYDIPKPKDIKKCAGPVCYRPGKGQEGFGGGGIQPL